MANQDANKKSSRGTKRKSDAPGAEWLGKDDVEYVPDSQEEEEVAPRTRPKKKGKKSTEIKRLKKELEEHQKALDDAVKLLELERAVVKSRANCPVCLGVPNPLYDEKKNPGVPVLVPVDPNTLGIFKKCGHHVCMRCIRGMVGRAFGKPTGRYPAGMFVNCHTIECPTCRVDTGISYYDSVKRLAMPQRLLIEHAGTFPHSVQLDCKCVGVDWTQQARWRHLLLCPATPIPCPFAKDFGGCTGTLQPRETSYGAVGMALRRHFETTCTHKIACVCGCNEVMEMRLITAHLSKMRFKLDVAGMMHYRISEMEASGAFSGIDPKSACEFKMVADVGCSWGEAIERSMPKMTADKMVKFFPHRSHPYFLDKAVTWNIHKDSIHYVCDDPLQPKEAIGRAEREEADLEEKKVMEAKQPPNLAPVQGPVRPGDLPMSMFDAADPFDDPPSPPLSPAYAPLAAAAAAVPPAPLLPNEPSFVPHNRHA